MLKNLLHSIAWLMMSRNGNKQTAPEPKVIQLTYMKPWIVSTCVNGEVIPNVFHPKNKEYAE